MIARKTNLPVSPPKHCIQRHFCLHWNGKCRLRCSSWDFTPRTGDVYARLDAEKTEAGA